MGQALRTFGPEFADAVRDLAAKMGVNLPGGAGAGQQSDSKPSAADAGRERREKRNLRYRDRLKAQLDGFDESVSAAFRKVLGENNWDLLSASAAADNHEDFYARVAQIKNTLQALGKEEANRLMVEVAKVVPPETVMLLKNLFEMTKEPL